MFLRNKILKVGIETIAQEIKTLEELKNQISEKFVQAVELINNSSGKCVFTGMGKSAIIAQKVTATFNSIGITSVFLHGADALHGDMGVVSDGDVILIFSKSGETSELAEFANCVAEKKVSVICFTSNPLSKLAKLANVHLNLPVHEETDSFDIIPTSSTIAQLALGDALAMALMEAKGTSLETLSRLHPQGSIGKKLLLSVKSIMQDDANPFISENVPLKDVIISITTHRLGATVVLENNDVVGIITDGDLRRILQSEENLASVKAKNIMSGDPICIDSAMRAYTALKLMEDRGITQLIVMEKGFYSGLIHIHDIIKAGIR